MLTQNNDKQFLLNSNGLSLADSRRGFAASRKLVLVIVTIAVLFIATVSGIVFVFGSSIRHFQVGLSQTVGAGKSPVQEYVEQLLSGYKTTHGADWQPVNTMLSDLSSIHESSRQNSDSFAQISEHAGSEMADIIQRLRVWLNAREFEISQWDELGWKLIEDSRIQEMRREIVLIENRRLSG